MGLDAALMIQPACMLVTPPSCLNNEVTEFRVHELPLD